ncbi:MAG: 16S rRNA (uracil(1498)-N(3))-methyltransferase [bacterium]|nr:16S rRNA (uracil(1498)-N(3))-methyltransferase [bacterium]
MSELWAHVEEVDSIGAVSLSAEEARHVATRRLRVGSEIVLFDGRGRVAGARLRSIARRETVVEIEEVREVPRPDSGFVLASAIPKGDRLSTMLQMLSQLGIGTWQPLVLDDSAVRRLDPGASRLRRILIESCKVARRAWSLDVRAPIDLGVALDSTVGPIFFGDREGEGGPLDSEATLLLIGPEAGFSEAEHRRLLEAGALPRSFATHNLRIETAAIAGAVAHQIARQT